jgi:hypothetical protein
MSRGKRIIVALAAAAALTVGAAGTALAGSPHFVDDQLTATRTGDTLTVSGKEAGLGSEESVHVVVEAKAACLNPGENFPQAANKESFSAAGDFPVTNGKAYFEVTVVFTFQPKCVPPMRLVIGDVTVTDTSNGISTTIPGEF